MKRIGIAASRIAKDDIVLYNVFVILLSTLFSMMIFCVSAFAILAGVALVSYATRGFMSIDAGSSIFRYMVLGLSAVVGLVNLVAILTNIKLKR
jgi:hypothetical protein